jgi:hypothetical protein
MAKKKRKSTRKRRHRTGSVVTTRTRKMSGLGQLNNPRSLSGALVPPLVGGGVAALVTIGIKSMTVQGHAQQQVQQQLQQQQGLGAVQGGGTESMLYKWAPALGVAGGGLASLLMSQLAGQSAGYGALAGALGVGGSLAAGAAMHEIQQKQVQGLYGHRTGAIVAEYGEGPLGALVLEPNSEQGYNSYSGGASVAVNGLGGRGTGDAVDPSAFGTQAF